jgi:putative hydrolase of the HAD superfamily
VRYSFHGVAEVSEALFTALYDSFSTHDAWRVYDDVIPSLEALQKRDIRLAVISNWDTRLKPTLKNVGLHDYFETITVSGEHGHNKPAREIFDATAAALHLPPGEILHIGDSHREDYLGARNAGFQALHLDREGEMAGAIASLEGVVSHLSARKGRTC